MTMKMAKANERDLDAAMKLCSALDALTSRWGAVMPAEIEKVGPLRETEEFDIDDPEHCRRVIEHLQRLANQGSLMRVVWGCAVMLDPANRMVDPDADTIEHHPDCAAGLAAADARRAKWAKNPLLRDWQRRVIDERDELAERLERLRKFYLVRSLAAKTTARSPGPSAHVDRDELFRMGTQSWYMAGYLDVLDARIEAFQPPAPAEGEWLHPQPQVNRAGG